MPYINQQLRKELEQRPPLRPGELTYELYRLALRYEGIETAKRAWHLCTQYLGERFRYDDAAIVIGCLESATLELQRRRKGNASAIVALHRVQDRLYQERIGPYEDSKIAENGDV